MITNPLLLTDVYKMHHAEQYPEGTTKIYSYLHSRSNKKYNEIVAYGLKYLIDEYLKKGITDEMVDEFLYYRKKILGSDAPEHLINKFRKLAKLDHIPLHIKSFPEGTILPAKSVIATVTNTHPDFYWVVGFFESLLLHAWYPITVASASRKYYKLVEKYAELTCDNNDHLPFSVHDFGYRGVTSEESAMIAGSAHLIHFLGSDTVPAVKFIETYYGKSDSPIGLSVPASEHSVMCCYGRDNEIKAFERMLDLYPTGIVSIVADGYDIYNAVTVIASQLKEQILARNGKVVFRPDSGTPINILLGDDLTKKGSNEYKGIFELLGEVFGYTINSKGYKVLNEKIGVIYGDGMTLNNFEDILERMQANKWATSNLVIGVGGLLLQSHSRDDLGFSFKATYAEINGESVNIFKDPITDQNKKSMTGLIRCYKDEAGQYMFEDNQNWTKESKTEFQTIFLNGQTYDKSSWDDVKKRALGN